LRREFALLASLRHPNLVEVFDLTADPRTGLPRFSMEAIDGEDLPTAIRREGPVAAGGARGRSPAAHSGFCTPWGSFTAT
jgi:hypothetical protein